MKNFYRLRTFKNEVLFLYKNCPSDVKKEKNMLRKEFAKKYKTEIWTRYMSTIFQDKKI